MLKAEAEATRVATMASFILILLRIDVNNELEYDVAKHERGRDRLEQGRIRLRCRERKRLREIFCVFKFTVVPTYAKKLFHSKPITASVKEGWFNEFLRKKICVQA